MSEILSKQQLKSKETKAKIFRAAKHILQKHGYEALSIKNICEEAGVSNGSFYHHFKTKDDLLSYYIEEQPNINPDLLDIPKSADEVKSAIVYVYLNYVHYCQELGVEFMANYLYSEKPVSEPIDPYRTSVPDCDCTQLSAEMYRCRNHFPNQDIEDITTDIRMIVIGNVFEWCLKEGNADFEGNMKRSLESYMNGVF